jgi:hypothetical protein
VAANIAALYPLPNRPGTVANYFTNMLRPYDYDAIMGRVDHNFSGNDRAFVSLYYNTRQEDRYNWAAEAANATNNGMINNVLVTQGFDYRSNRGLTLGYTTSRFAMWVVDVRYSNTTFGEYRDPAQEIDPASLGFAPSAVQAMQGYKYLPMITFAQFSTTNQNSTIATLGSQRADWNQGFNRPMTTNSFSATVTRIWGDHNIKLGYELRHQNWVIESAGYQGGRYHFNGATVQRNVLLRPYPHFNTFAVEVYDGSDSYTSATVQLQKRFRGGNSLTMQYTKSETRDKLNYLNPPAGILEDRVSPNDRPHRFSIGSSLQLPFGRAERWGSEWGGATEALRPNGAAGL